MYKAPRMVVVKRKDRRVTAKLQFTHCSSTYTLAAVFLPLRSRHCYVINSDFIHNSEITYGIIEREK